jgi:quercetin dioxygenase-like cupin family protein
MRVPAQRLSAARDGALVLRYALLGPAAYLLVEVPESGSAGTSLERPCVLEHWGVVLRGELILEGAGSRETLRPGDAFHVPAGPPSHTFHAGGPCLVAGFVPTPEPIDGSPAALRRLGLTPTDEALASDLQPTAVSVVGTSKLERIGEVEVESAEMGPWQFTRTTFGPLSGYSSGWCDLPHWGLVLAGDAVLRTESGSELLGLGDAFLCPAGPPAHRFEVADFATIVDYTPREAMASAARREAWRPLIRTTRVRHRRPAATGTSEEGAAS